MRQDEYRSTIPEGRSGHWRVERFTVPKVSIEGFRLALEGRPVRPGQYTRLVRDGAWDPMMSDTPAEVADVLPFVRAAEGRVLMNGLGLGVALQAVLRKPEIEAVDVVEIEPDIISLVGRHFTDRRLTIHHADAFTIQWPPGKRWDFVWHDIWPSICSDHLAQMRRLRRRYAERTTWQGGWAEMECRSPRFIRP